MTGRTERELARALARLDPADRVELVEILFKKESGARHAPSTATGMDEHA